MEAVSSSKNNHRYLLIKIMSYPITFKSSSTLQWGLKILHICTCPPWLFTHHNQTDEWVCWVRSNSTSQELIYSKISIPYVLFSCNYGSFLMVLKITHTHNELLHQMYHSSTCHFSMPVIQNTQSWLWNRLVWTGNWHCFVSNIWFQLNSYKLQIYLEKSDFHASMNVILYYKI